MKFQKNLTRNKKYEKYLKTGKKGMVVQNKKQKILNVDISKDKQVKIILSNLIINLKLAKLNPEEITKILSDEEQR